MNFSNYEKVKSFVETFATYNQILFIGEQVWMSSMDFIFDIGQAQINSLHDAPPVICHSASKFKVMKRTIVLDV